MVALVFLLVEDEGVSFCACPKARLSTGEAHLPRAAKPRAGHTPDAFVPGSDTKLRAPGTSQSPSSANHRYCSLCLSFVSAYNRI